jgi:hypothetical protein
MLVRQRLVTFGIPTAAVATVGLAALLGQRATPVEPAPDAPTTVDVVFAVDTTSSMSGLIDGAKRTVWSIATEIRKARPDAKLRIGLVAYRDIGDSYVTRPFALTSDLDAVFAELSSYQAQGGGDEPEDVDAALDSVLHVMQWRAEAQKLVFLVGDAPPSSRGEVPSFEAAAREAADRGITINAIRCGSSATAGVAFQRIAALAHGEYSTIAQDGGVQQVATPYDAEIAALQDEIDGTVVVVGDGAVHSRYRAKAAAAKAAPAAAKADRAGYYASGSRDAGDDLVGRYEAGGVALEEVASDKLPEDLRGKDTTALKQELDRRVAKRAALQGKLQLLVKQRAAEVAKTPSAGAGFDAKVKATVTRQLK